MQYDGIEYCGERVIGYDERHFSIPTYLSTRRLRNRMQRISGGNFDPINYKRALDIGCGTGNILLKLMLMGVPEGYGLDISPDMLRYLQENLPPGIKPESVVGNAERTPFSDGSFDLIVCNSALHHFPDYKRVLEEIYRLLEVGGEAFILHEKNKTGREYMKRVFDFERFEDRDTDAHEFTAPQIRSNCQEIGFSTINVRSSDALSFIYHKLVRPRVPTDLLKDVGYSIAESLDSLLSGTPISEYFVHLCIYLRK